jgi:diacylglycerol kinase
MRAFLRGFGFAFSGIVYAVQTQRNLRVHFVISALVILAGVYFRLAPLEWAVIAVTIGLVLGVEMINTVAELAVDLLTQRYHPMAKVAKDVGAGAVLVTALCAVAVGIAIFGPRLLALIKP